VLEIGNVVTAVIEVIEVIEVVVVVEEVAIHGEEVVATEILIVVMAEALIEEVHGIQGHHGDVIHEIEGHSGEL